MVRLNVFMVAVLAIVCLAAASEATTKFTCNGGGRVWDITAGMWPIEVTLTVDKSATDCDILVDDGDIFVALGLGIESRFETVKFAVPPGRDLFITAIKANGPNSKAYLRANDSRRFIAISEGEGGRFRSALERAREDPAYARMLDDWRYYKRLKAAGAADAAR